MPFGRFWKFPLYIEQWRKIVKYCFKSAEKPSDSNLYNGFKEFFKDIRSVFISN